MAHEPGQLSVAKREIGLQKLNQFLHSAAVDYPARRNFDFGPGQHKAVSGLSAYIRHRLVSEPEVLARTLTVHEFGRVSKFIEEVFWRTYWKGWLEHNPAVWTRYLKSLEQAHRALDRESGLYEDYLRAVNGESGIGPFDAWIRELRETGYIHNHARMWFASIWIFSLRLPWVLGADFFLRHLLDGDCASNTLSWRWVAGLQTQGKAYLTTVDNLRKFAADRFFSASQVPGLKRLATRAVPLQEAPLPDASPLDLPSGLERREGDGLLLTEEDLGLDVGFEPGAVSVWRPEANGITAFSEAARGFKRDACADALSRSQLKWPNVDVSQSLTSTSSVVDWVQQHALRTVHMAHVPQGFIKPSLTNLASALGDVGCELSVFTRAYDGLCWPHCRRGFFQLRKQIPMLIERMALDKGLLKASSVFNDEEQSLDESGLRGT